MGTDAWADLGIPDCRPTGTQFLHGFQLNRSSMIASRNAITLFNASNNAGESTEFIEFMLSAIKTSLMETLKMSDERSTTTERRWKIVQSYLERHDPIQMP